MSIGGKGQAVMAGKEEVPFEIGCRHHALGEELQVVPSKTVILLLLEMGNGGFQVQWAAHDVPGNGHPVLVGNSTDLLGEQLKEGFPFDGTDTERAFRPIVSQAGSLATGYGEGGGLASPDEALSVFKCLCVEDFVLGSHGV